VIGDYDGDAGDGDPYRVGVNGGNFLLSKESPWLHPVFPMLSEAEWKTRKERIDTKLRKLSEPWDIVPHKPSLDVSKLKRVAVTEYPTENGPADYALFADGQLLRK